MPRSPAQKEDTQRQRAEVLRLRRTGMSFTAIGEQLGVTRQRAHQVYSSALAEIPAQEVHEYRVEQAARLDALLERANEVLAANAVMVQHGKVVMLDGSPVPDPTVILAAIKTILDVEQRRAKLLGLDAPTQQQLEVDGGLRYEIVGLDPGQMA